jgi:hypothetical protein
VPQGCLLSPLLYSLFTYDCVPVHCSNTIAKFTDDTTVVGLISDNDESAYREEVNTWLHGELTTTWPSMQRKPRRSLWITGSLKAATTPKFSLMALRWSVCPASNCWVSTFQMTSPGPSTPQTWSKRHIAAPVLFEEAEEGPPVSQDPRELLPLHGRENSD